MPTKSLGLAVLLLATIGLLGAQSGEVYNTGIGIKKPVFGGACKLCPWGAMGQVVKKAMKYNGYDVQTCFNCNATATTRIVSHAEVPPPYKKDPAVSVAMAPPNAPGLGPVDFGATAEQFLCDAYHGRGVYAKDKPMDNLRLIANIQSPWSVTTDSSFDTWPARVASMRVWITYGCGPVAATSSVNAAHWVVS